MRKLVTVVLALFSLGATAGFCDPKPTATPESSLLSNLSTLQLSYEEKAFFQKVSGLYYDYRPRGLKLIRC